MRVASRLLKGSAQCCSEAVRFLRSSTQVYSRQNRIDIAGAYSEDVLHHDVFIKEESNAPFSSTLDTRTIFRKQSLIDWICG
jgi:hypothetical protein